MIARILWLALLVGLGAVTAALQLDRQALSNPAMAAFVLAPMRGYAQTQMAQAALKGDDPAAALAAAEALVRRRPMPAEHLTLLASAQACAGRPEPAAFSIQMAGQRGWRDPVAQEAVLRIALAAGDKAEAARRYAALLRREATPDDLLVTLGPEIFAEPGGAARQTLGTIIAGATRWHSLFLQRGMQVLPPDAFGEVVAIALERGAPFECGTVAPVAQSLGGRDAAAGAKLAAAIRQRCG